MTNLYFPRGDGPLISFLIPTRNRSQQLCKSIDSCYSLAVDKSAIEFILKIDEDDTLTIQTYEKLKGLGINIRALISPRGNGYLSMHHWVNHMACNLAKGDWIMAFNDDALIATESYDQILFEATMSPEATWHGCRDIVYFLCQTVNRPEATEFGFLRRKVVDILGHFSLNVHGDTWIMAVCCGVSATFKVPVYIHHNNVQDEIREKALEAYKIAGLNLNTCEAYRQKANDTLKLVDYIEQWQKDRDIFREIIE